MLTTASRLFVLNGALRKLVLYRWTWAHNCRVQSCERYWRWRAHCKWEIHCRWPWVGTILNFPKCWTIFSEQSMKRCLQLSGSLWYWKAFRFRFRVNSCTVFCVCCIVLAYCCVAGLPMNTTLCMPLPHNLASFYQVKCIYNPDLLKKCAATVYSSLQIAQLRTNKNHLE